MPVEISNSQLYLVYVPVLTVQDENIFCKATEDTVP